MLRRLAPLAALALACTSFDFTAPRPGPPQPGTFTGRAVVEVPGSTRRVPVAGAVVTLLRSSVSVKTGEDGMFTLGPITGPGATAMLQLDADGDGRFERQRLLALDDFGAGANRFIVAGDLLLHENGSVSGRVLLEDHAGQRSGHAGTAVFIPEGPFTVYAGDDGSWSLPSLPEGHLTFAFFHEGYAPASVSGLDLQPGQALQLKDVTLHPQSGPSPSAHVSGTLRFDPALADASAATVALKSGERKVSLSVDASGAFSGDAPYGVYVLVASAPGYTDAPVPNVPLVAPSVEGLSVALSTAPSVPPSEGGPPTRDAPVADARGPSFAAPGDRVQLDGSASRAQDGHRLSFKWRQLQGSAVTLVPDDSSAQVSFTAPAVPAAPSDGLVFELTVTDEANALTAAKRVAVDVFAPPHAVIAAQAVVPPGASVPLDGSGSTAPGSHPLQYAWSANPASTFLPSAAEAKPSVSVGGAGVVTVTLQVTDAITHFTDSATARITVGGPSASIAAAAQAVAGLPFTLDGSASNGKNTLSFTWTQIRGDPVAFSANQSPAAAKTSFLAPVKAQLLEFALTVTDTGYGTPLTDTATRVVEVVEPPVAKLVAPAVAAVGTAVALDGSGSSAPGSTGTTNLSFHWSATPAAVITPNDSPFAARPTLIAPSTSGPVDVELTVTDLRSKLTAKATGRLDVFTKPTGVITPATLQVAADSTFVLDGSKSVSPDGLALTYAWSLGGTGGSIVGRADGPTVTVRAPALKATLPVELVVSTPSFASAKAVALVEVDTSPVPPRVSAGADRLVAAGSVVTLAGTATHPDPTETLALQWTQVAGTPQVTLAGEQTAAPSFTAPSQPTTLTFRLMATGTTSKLSASDDVVVEVQDLNAPKVVATSPIEGGTGSPFLLSATFDEALDPASVRSSTVYVSDAAGTKVAASLRWEPATKTVFVSPAYPLAGGAAYTLTLDGVTDLSTARNALSPKVSVSFHAADPRWKVWTTTETSTRDVFPAVGVSKSEVVVFGWRQNGACAGLDPNSPSTWSVKPDANGTLVDESFCKQLDGRFPARTKPMHLLGGQLYLNIGGSDGYCCLAHYQYRRTAAGWVGSLASASGGVTFDDGTGMYTLLPANNTQGLQYSAFDASKNSWSAYVPASPPGSATQFFCDATLGAAGAPGVLYAAAPYYNAGGCYYSSPPGPGTSASYLVAYTNTGSGWTQLPNNPASATSVLQSYELGAPKLAVGPGTDLSVVVPQRVGANLALHALHFSVATQTWTDLGLVTTANVGSFDVAARGNMLAVAFVSGTQLNLRTVDLGAAAPSWKDAGGPNGVTLNRDSACLTNNPSLEFGEDGLWIAASESCAANTWTLLLEKLY